MAQSGSQIYRALRKTKATKTSVDHSNQGYPRRNEGVPGNLQLRQTPDGLELVCQGSCGQWYSTTLHRLKDKTRVAKELVVKGPVNSLDSIRVRDTEVISKTKEFLGNMTADKVSDFDTEVSNNASVTANTAKVSATLANVNALAITELGTIATGTWQGTDVGVSHGGTGASTSSTARTNLGLAIGSDIQAHHADLDSLSPMQAGAAAALAVLTSTEIGKIDGLTATTAELNIMDGVTATTAELNFVDIASEGVIEARKAVILNSSSKVNQWNVDSLRLDGNTISSQNINGNIILTPIGTGKVQVTASNLYLQGRSSITFSDRQTAPSLTNAEVGIWNDGVSGILNLRHNSNARTMQFWVDKQVIVFNDADYADGVNTFSESDLAVGEGALWFDGGTLRAAYRVSSTEVEQSNFNLNSAGNNWSNSSDHDTS